MLRSLKIPVEKLRDKEIDSVKQRVTCLDWELGYTPRTEVIKAAISHGFAKHLGIKLVPGELTDEEQRRFKQRRAYFHSRAWIDQVKPIFQKRETVQGVYKCGSGLVRFTLVVNPGQKRLKDIYITGDFLSFPPKALYGLEAELKGMRLDQELMETKIRGYFEGGHIRIPGMTCTDFLKPLDLAFKKIAIADYGIPLEYCNQISVTNGTFEEVLGKSPSVLLLPYCAKHTGCELRYRKHCMRCGDCSVGDAWAMGLAQKLKVVTVVSFEDLMAELNKMKKSQVPAFIGCCCDPFFSKHVDDFAKAGVPGILLNIDDTTCYDLDQAKSAYAGRFSSQTHLNLDLLNRVLCCMPDAGNSIPKAGEAHPGIIAG